MKTQQLDLFQATDFIEPKQRSITTKVTLTDRRAIIDLREVAEGLNRGTDSHGSVFRMWIAAPLKKIHQLARQVGGRDEDGLQVYFHALMNAIDEPNFPRKNIEFAVVRFNFESFKGYRALSDMLNRRQMATIRQLPFSDGSVNYIGGIRPFPLLRLQGFITLDGNVDEVGLAMRAGNEFISADDKNPEHVMQYIVHIWDGVFQSTELSVREHVRRHMDGSERVLPPVTIRCLDELDAAFGAAARFALTSPLSVTSMTLRRKVRAILTESLEVKTNHDRDGSWRFLAVLTESFLLAAAPRGLEIKPVGWVHPIKRKTENRISQ